MITGFNTDVDYQGQVYHVQTEDKGLDNPLVESLIYCGGEIVSSRRSSYEELAGTEGFSEDEVQRRMENQHNALIRDIRNGQFDPDSKKPFGHMIISNRSLDQVVLNYLMLEQVTPGGEAGGDPEALMLEAIDWQVLESGTRPTLRLKVLRGAGKSPVADARVTVSLREEGRTGLELFSADTDSDGFIEASFQIPDTLQPAAEILCEAEADGLRGQFTQAVK